MNRTIRRLAILFAAICVMMIMAVPAFADADPGYYVVGTPVTYDEEEEITVKLMIESRTVSLTDLEVINELEDVTLTGKTSYTVLDVLRAYNDMLTGIQICNTSGQPLTTTDTFISSIKKGAKTYSYLFFYDLGEGRIPVDGWMFRVNGRYPALDSNGFHNGPTGCLIHQAPVANGDVVTLYTSCPFELFNTDYSTAFVSADLEQDDDTGDYYIQLKSCNEDHNGRWTFDLNDCTYYANNNRTATLYEDDWTPVTTITFSASGKAAWPSNVSSGTYYLLLTSTQKWTSRSAYAGFSGNTMASCYCLESTILFDRIVK